MARQPFGFITRTYSFMQRYRHILLILLKYGFEDVIETLRIEQYLRFRRYFQGKDKRIEHMSRAARIRMAIEELGPTFIKMGQILSTRADILPPDVLQELATLQDQARSFSTEEAHAILKKELGAPSEEIFESFEDKPIAAGSIGQVHRARLHNGREVAIKIQRPGIHKVIETDLEIMHHMAHLMERHMEVGQIHRPSAIVNEFEHTIKRELDYSIELANIERFARMFETNPHVYVFDVFTEYSSDKVLTTEFVKGAKPDTVAGLEAAGLNPKEIARQGADLVMAQVFVHGFYHADPHPGNIFVLEDNIICFLDFGMVGRLDRSSREIFAQLILEILQNNEVDATEALLRLTHGHTLVDRQMLERGVAELIDQYLYRPLKEIEVGKLVSQVLDLTVKHELRIPAQYFLLIKAITQIEDLGRALDPDFDFSERAGPYIRRILMDRYHPKRIVRDAYETGLDLVFLLKEVPGELRELLKQARQGKMQVELKHHGLRPLRATLARLSNRISSAIVLASMIIGSSLIVNSRVPPLWREIPVIGLAGYLISAVLGLILLRSIWKERE